MTKIAEICDSIGEKMDKITDWKTLKVESLGFRYDGFNYEDEQDSDGSKLRVWQHYWSVIINGIDTGYSVDYEYYGSGENYDLSGEDGTHEECIDFTEAHETVGKLLGMEMKQFEKFKYVHPERTGYPRITDVDMCYRKKGNGKLLIYKIKLDDGSSFVDSEKYDFDDPFVCKYSAEKFAQFVVGLEGRTLDKVMRQLAMGDAI